MTRTVNHDHAAATATLPPSPSRQRHVASDTAAKLTDVTRVHTSSFVLCPSNALCPRETEKTFADVPYLLLTQKNTSKHKINTKQTHTRRSRSKTPPGGKLSASVRQQSFEVTPRKRALSAADPEYTAGKQDAPHVPRRSNEKFRLYLTTLQVV